MPAKNTLRLHFQALRDRLSSSQRAAAAKKIGEHLVAMPVYRSATYLFIYAAYRSEVATKAIIAAAIQGGKRVAVPRLTDKKGIMEAVPIAAVHLLQPGTFNIPEPPATLKATDDLQFDLILIPGLAFDKYGHRLGYGGGYYDRFLAQPNCTGYRLGVGYAAQLTDRLPVASYDQPLDGLLTENGLLTPQHA